MVETLVTKRKDGVVEERLDGRWTAEYREDPLTGLYRVEVFHHDVSEWAANNYPSIEEAQQAAHEYYDELIS